MKKAIHSFALVFLFRICLPAQCPEILNCPTQPISHCDLSPNNGELWNNAAFYDPIHGVHDVAEATVELSIAVRDACNPAGLQLSFVLLLDLDGNGSRESAVWSESLPADGTIRFGNAANPNYSGGTPQPFDSRPVAADHKYRFALEQTLSGDELTGRVRWSTAQAPGTYVDPALPGGTHKIRWFVQSGSVKDSCEYTFSVQDCKKPTVVCLPGWSVNIMPTGMTTLWASDFLQYTEDNITPDGQLKIGIRKSGTGSGFPLDGNGNPVTSVTFVCDEQGTQLVELWSIDKAGNADFCETYVIVQDNMGNCGFDPEPTQVCAKTACNDEYVEEVSFSLSTSGPGIPSFIFTSLSNSFGCASVNWMPSFNNTIITPWKDDNPLNGVTTYDLVLISKHILGIEPFNAPWKFIAADANGNGSVSTFDVVELRKLILGLVPELPNNTSWRFYPSDHVFPNPANPFLDPIPGSVTMADVFPWPGGKFYFDAVKIGDVNCTAIAHSVVAPAEDREAFSLYLPDLVLPAGQSMDIPVTLSGAAEWLGFQLALQYDESRVIIEKILPGALSGLEENNFGRPRPGLLTASWSDTGARPLSPGDVLFTLRVRATTPLALRDAFRILPEQLSPEAYTEGATPRQPLQLDFKSVSGKGTETMVYPPRPNPADGAFQIPVRLYSAGSVGLELYDFSGKKMYTAENQLDAGATVIPVPADALPMAGVYAWKVRIGESIFTGKIVRK